MKRHVANLFAIICAALIGMAIWAIIIAVLRIASR
jgi:ABC-type uncharacterized transport system permease subunit